MPAPPPAHDRGHRGHGHRAGAVPAEPGHFPKALRSAPRVRMQSTLRRNSEIQNRRRGKCPRCRVIRLPLIRVEMIRVDPIRVEMIGGEPARWRTLLRRSRQWKTALHRNTPAAAAGVRAERPDPEPSFCGASGARASIYAYSGL